MQYGGLGQSPLFSGGGYLTPSIPNGSSTCFPYEAPQQGLALQWLSWQNFTLIFENAGTAFLAAKNAFSQNFVSRMKKTTILFKYFSYDFSLV